MLLFFDHIYTKADQFVDSCEIDHLNPYENDHEIWCKLTTLSRLKLPPEVVVVQTDRKPPIVEFSG